MFFTILLVSVLAASTAAAETLINVDVTSESVCPCSTMTVNDFEIFIENTGDAAETYSLGMELPEDELWSRFIFPEPLTVAAGEKRPVPSFITPSCWVTPGRYVIRVSAVAQSTGKETVKNFLVEVGKCRWIDITAGDYEACQDKATAFEVEFTNEGGSDEEFVISIDREWITLSEETLMIKVGEKKSVDVLVKPPSDVEGEVEVVLDIESLVSYVKNTETFTIDVKKCYGTDFDVEPLRADICPCKTAEFKLSIRNSGLVEDQFTVKYGDHEDRLVLAPDAEGLVSLVIEVPCDKMAGDYPVPIEIESNSPLKSSVTVGVLPSEYCYSVSLTSDGTGQEVEVGQSATFAVSIFNEGLFEQAYMLSVEGPEWAYLTENNIMLEPEAENTFYVYMAPGFETREGLYEIMLTASAGNEESSMTFNISVVTEFAGEPETENDTAEPEAEIGIPTGEVTGVDSPDKDRSWSQIIMITILAIGVVFILILRFVVMMS